MPIHVAMAFDMTHDKDLCTALDYAERQCQLKPQSSLQVS